MSKNQPDLQQILAGTAVLYFKTHSFHWNVTGPDFGQLHELFGQQYTEMWESLDEIAERMRAIKQIAPHTFASLLKSSAIDETDAAPDAKKMVATLAKDHETLIGQLADAIKFYQDDGDEGTADLLTNRLKVHQKNAWMLRSILG